MGLVIGENEMRSIKCKRQIKIKEIITLGYI